MKKTGNTWMKKGLLLAAAGCLIFLGCFAALGFDLSRLNGAQWESRSYTLTKHFDDIRIDSATADVTFVRSEDGACRVEVDEMENVPHTVAVENGVLTVQEQDLRKWYEHLIPAWGQPQITVYLPDSAYDSVTVDVTTGSVTAPSGFSFRTASIRTTTGSVAWQSAVSEKLDIRVTTGSIRAAGVSCRQAAFSSVTGSVTLRNVIAADTLTASTTTGSIHLEGVDGAHLSFHVTTGSITGTVLTEKVFTAQSTTGSVSVPDTTSGGDCTAVTTTGSVKIQLP